MTGLLLRDVEVRGARVDVRVADDHVVEVAPALRPLVSEEVLDASGGALLPGLHDHHIHLLATAAALRSVNLGAPGVVDPASFDQAIRAAHRALPHDAWLRGVAYDEVVAGELDRRRLDALAPVRPVRVQHRSGAMWVLNSRALALIRVDEPTGRLFRCDDLLRDRLPDDPPPLADVGERLLRYGVTGVTDATPTERSGDLELIAATELPQQVTVMGGPRLDPVAGPGMARGPVKLVIADHEVPALDEVIADMRTARTLGRSVAVHCVTRAALALAVAAWDEVGAIDGDRVEHASVAPPELVAALADHGITVVTQPNFVCERGDAYRAAVDLDDLPHLYPCRSLLDAGVRVGAGTDAPYGDLDPWRAIAAATTRETRTGHVLGADQRLTAAEALRLFLGPAHDPGGHPRRIVPGAPADLCVLSVSLHEALAAPSSEFVAATICSGTPPRPKARPSGEGHRKEMQEDPQDGS